ncbi:MAG: hypothetical protein ACOCRK_11965 [bacterium]
MNEFNMMYLGQFPEENTKYRMAQKLWLIYDYKTETFDQNIAKKAAKENSYVQFSVCEKSQINTNYWRDFIYDVADYFNIDSSNMNRAKYDNFRGFSVERRIEKYKEYLEQGLLDFVNEVPLDEL